LGICGDCCGTAAGDAAILDDELHFRFIGTDSEPLDMDAAGLCDIGGGKQETIGFNQDARANPAQDKQHDDALNGG